jgi:indolepyruvate ferredoxin oxidoreductase beta subunit
MSAVTSVLLAGVGGQGVLLASEVIAEAAAIGGSAVKKSEVHGMAQRGGSVVSHLRFGPEVHSPLIPRAGADYLVSFERLETLRYLEYLHPGSVILVNDQRILPLPVSVGKAVYPEDVEARLAATGLPVRFVDGVGLARAAGNEKAVNAVVLGALSGMMGFAPGLWEQALRRQVPERLLEVNLRAFALGRDARPAGGIR